MVAIVVKLRQLAGHHIWPGQGLLWLTVGERILEEMQIQKHGDRLSVQAYVGKVP
jgi:hypothetical protein